VTSTSIDAVRSAGVVDVDTHLTEPWDLWTARAPERYRDRVPQVREVDGRATWIFDGAILGPALAASVVRRDGSKAYGLRELFEMTVAESHPGAQQIQPRLELMDELGVWAQILYPNTLGFGGQRFIEAADPKLRALAVTIWNDAMAEIQDESEDRLFPMGLLPWWDIRASIRELGRIRDLGLRGVITNADPQKHGYSDLGDATWDPLWEAIAGSGLPLNFHIGASAQQEAYFGDTPWPSQTDDAKLALGSAMIMLGNARILGNFIFSGILERHPSLKLVSVESGIGWIPFVLQALDYQLEETAPSATEYLSMKPSEYFRRQIYACFWFEHTELPAMIDAVGADNCMFETDFPHPTCLYPDSVKRGLESLSTMDGETVQKVMRENAVAVYSLPGCSPR
jgi:uncharacterized protein